MRRPRFPQKPQFGVTASLPQSVQYTAPAVLRGLMDALVLGITLWKAPPVLSPTEETWYVDVAYHDSRWTVALWTPARPSDGCSTYTVPVS